MMPLSVDAGVTSEAVTLFVQRAGAVRAEYAIHDEQTAAAVIEICETLDGLPLGIELAAARMAAMSATEVRDRLTDRMRLLTGPELGPDRQSTLRHAVAWSYDLLDEDERDVLRTAAVFSGGFVLESLCAVAGEDDDIEMLRRLDSLVRKSLVVAQHDTERTRYSLYDTIRLYAEEQLADAGRLEGARDQARGVLRPTRRSVAGTGGTAPSGVATSTGCRRSWPTCARRTAGARSAATSRWPPTWPRTPR